MEKHTPISATPYDYFKGDYLPEFIRTCEARGHDVSSPEKLIAMLRIAHARPTGTDFLSKLLVDRLEREICTVTGATATVLQEEERKEGE